MPIYVYKCLACNEEVEVVHSMRDLDLPYFHSCGTIMARLPTTFSFSFPIGNRDHVLKALNGELPLPATRQDRPRIEKALAKGLNRKRPVIGKGI